ncbi:MAG: hypothetical protein GF421_12340 [Candidatus Aminicenantes bacterium]|nr:hypothetical protein [Candidatus Aminicenantes bacterium]
MGDPNTAKLNNTGTEKSWDYLILTASNQTQKRFYRNQLELRRGLGLLSQVKKILVVPDPPNQRIGSGGSTVFALLQVLNRECKNPSQKELTSAVIEKILSRLRILIIHAGGDSRRMPAYGPCGKIFTPLPSRFESLFGDTIFDRQFPMYRDLPFPCSSQGQVVIASGDVLLFFSPQDVQFQTEGITGLACSVSPEQAKKHGVFVAENSIEVRLFLQKPSVAKQKKRGAVNSKAQSLLDIGVMGMDALTSARLMSLIEIKKRNRGFVWAGPNAKEITSFGMDFYRDICCAMGNKIDFHDFVTNVRSSGSKLSESFLKAIYATMSKVPFFVHPLRQCTFLHFGTPRQLIETGSRLVKRDQSSRLNQTLLSINNHVSDTQLIKGTKSWVEGCWIRSTLNLQGENVVVGADVDKPLSLKAKTCLDVIKGRSRYGEPVWFVRIYGLDDCFKASIHEKSLFANHPFLDWLKITKVSQKEIWDEELKDSEKKLWNAKIFPAVSSPDHYWKWLWMSDPSQATQNQIQSWKKADKYSLEQITHLADLKDFHQKRWNHRIKKMYSHIDKTFQKQSPFSARDLELIFKNLDEKQREQWIHNILTQACCHLDTHNKTESEIDKLTYSRISHSLATAVKQCLTSKKKKWNQILQSALTDLSEKDKNCLESLGIDSSSFQDAETWCRRLKESAFENLSQTIVWSQRKAQDHPQSAVRSDAIIWGRAPARLDLGGGWTDTPPYALEKGGCVINTAVNLNRQPPIHVYARVINEPIIRITSIDHGLRISINQLDDLMDYHKATSKFSLAKAALVLSGFSKDTAIWPRGTQTLKDMLEHFGGGIELTTLAAIPSGSGLGTSSIMGAVLVAVINRMMAREINQRELFNQVLQLEQELTTGGGWQDQIGGTLGGTKIITTQPGLVPDPKIKRVQSDVLNSRTNQRQTLLYYTGLRRLAKNILRNIVSGYLDRNRKTMNTLHRLHMFPPLLVDAMESKDMQSFGELINRALYLKKEIDPDSINPEIIKILNKFKPFMIGATILGAGGGGFLLVVAKSPQDAKSARQALTKDPPNPLARFFDFDISTAGLEVTVC